MVTGQGHAALGCSIAGANERINAFTTGRLVGDTLGTLRDGPGGAALPGYGTPVTTAYNPPGDPGGSNGRRWGDYSYTSLDPNDDMTMWTIQEFCNGTNTYGCRVAKLLAPPPATPASASSSVPRAQSSANVTITGTVISGSGFYEPGAAFPNHIAASVSGSGVVVNSTTFVSPTQVMLNLNTSGAATGARNVTVTNPDGQARTGNGILTISGALPIQLTAAASRKMHGAAGIFDIILPLAGDPGVECRGSGDTHSLRFTFNNTVTSGTASVTTGTGTVSGPATFAGNVMTVNLTGVTDLQEITVTLANVTDAAAQVLPNTPVSMNVLLGDTNGNKAVNATDVGQTKSQSGIALALANFRSDTNASGGINATDIGQVKTNSGHFLP
jgi:hypothetical protein